MDNSKTEQEQWWMEYGGIEWFDKMSIGENHGLTYQKRLLNMALAINNDIDFKTDSFLEVGCGYGRILRHLMEQFKGININGCDQSDSMLDRAVSCDIPSNILTNVNIRTDTSSIGIYDIVYTCIVLIHIPPHLLLGVLENILALSRKYVIHIENLHVPVSNKIDDAHNGCWRHNIINRYGLLGKKCQQIDLKGACNSGYIIKV